MSTLPWLGEDKLPTVRGQLEQMIDTARSHSCKDFDSFLAAMKTAGAEVKRGKHLAFKIPNGKRFVRCDPLGVDHTEAAIMERISGKRIVAPKAKAAAQSKPNLLIDIHAKKQMIELLTAKNNVERILGMTEKEKNRDRQQEAR